jgi:hypothetical protein
VQKRYSQAKTEERKFIMSGNRVMKRMPKLKRDGSKRILQGKLQ